MKSYSHYCYKIEFPTGHVYFGVRSCNCKPKDDTYLGSPYTHKEYWDLYEPKKTILKEFSNRKEAEEAEKFLINWQWNSTDTGKNLSLNAAISNVNFNTLGLKLSEEAKNKMSYCFTVYDPEGNKISGVNISNFAKQNNLNPTHLCDVVRGDRFHHQGWTVSEYAHKLYLQYFKVRGVSKKNQRWQVPTEVDGIKVLKYFNSFEEAIEHRDKQAKKGQQFLVRPKNWKEKLQEVSS